MQWTKALWLAHQRHLTSPYWLDLVRPAMWDKARGRDYLCERCKTSDRCRYDIHHVNYNFHFHEMDGLHSLALYCCYCHDYVHGRTSIDPRRFSEHQIEESVESVDEQLEELIRENNLQEL